jgi:hypothetical protein
MGVGLYSCEFRFHPSLAFVVKGKQIAKPGVLNQPHMLRSEGINEARAIRGRVNGSRFVWWQEFDADWR